MENDPGECFFYLIHTYRRKRATHRDRGKEKVLKKHKTE